MSAPLGEGAGPACSTEHVRIETQATAALQEMAERRVAPTPENYAVWYSWAGGTVPDLKRAIDLLIAEGRAFTPEVSVDLYERFFGHDQQAEGLREVGIKIEEAANQALATMSSVGADARQYGAELGGHVEALGASASSAPSPDLAKVHDVIQTILNDTRSMVERTQVLERRMLRSATRIKDLRREVEDVRREALTDPLTGIGNRKLFDQRLREGIRAARESGAEFCLAMLDIDHFKRFNDTWGHQMGDLVLRLVARSLLDGIKGRDLAARYGGEEFAIILPDTSLEHASKLADALRKTIGERQIRKRDTKESLGQVTLSCGVTRYLPGEPASRLIDRADAALYRAKQAGRNRVITDDFSMGLAAAQG